jgi:phosphosulfolactate synthase (CoM biosynthesis protein A)
MGEPVERVESDDPTVIDYLRLARPDLTEPGNRRRHQMTPSTPAPTVELAFPFLRANECPPKPRTRGVTETRGPYYSVMGPRYLKDVLDTMGEHVDALKFAGGSFTLMPETALREIIEIAHEHDVLVSTGGFIEHVLTLGPDAVERYVDEVARVGFDILEVSAGFISIPTDDMLRLWSASSAPA